MKNNVWFTADMHFGHANINRLCNRPFRTITEMDETIISNYNELVKHDDIVYILGDVTLRNYRFFTNYCRRLKGNISILPGNHDRKWIKSFGAPLSMSGHKITLLPPIHNINLASFFPTKSKLLIVMSHYALRVWDKSHFNSYQLHGHSHGTLRPIGKQHDVGVDFNNFCPISIEELQEIMKEKPDNINFVGR